MDPSLLASCRDANAALDGDNRKQEAHALRKALQTANHLLPELQSLVVSYCEWHPSLFLQRHDIADFLDAHKTWHVVKVLEKTSLIWLLQYVNYPTQVQEIDFRDGCKRIQQSYSHFSTRGIRCHEFVWHRSSNSIAQILERDPLKYASYDILLVPSQIRINDVCSTALVEL